MATILTIKICFSIVDANNGFVLKICIYKGIRNWAGKQIHSHNYRVPEPYGGQVVVVIGAGPSAYDISQDICKVAKQVHLSSRSNDVKISKLSENVWQHSEVCITEIIFSIGMEGSLTDEEGF